MAVLAILICVLIGHEVSQAQRRSRPLELHFIDVEGGGATLIVTPAGESVLMDAGWSDVDGRDARRIQAAMTRAGVTRIDHLIASHYHMDHYGGVPDLAGLVPVGRSYDHGPMSEMKEDELFHTRHSAYRKAVGDRAVTVSPGFTINLKGGGGAPAPVLRVIAANARVLDEKGLPNPACVLAAPQQDSTENGRSVAILLKFGDFDFLNLADLTWTVSRQLVCPMNQTGRVDLYQVTHHGGDASNDALLLKSLNPTTAVMINGARKGGHPDAIRRLIELPSLRALYQLHRNVQIDDAMNTRAEFIANLDEAADRAHPIVASVDPSDGTFTITNGRTNVTHTYRVN